MRHKGWVLRATDRGQHLVKALRTPSGAHAGERLVEIPLPVIGQLSHPTPRPGQDPIH